MLLIVTVVLVVVALVLLILGFAQDSLTFIYLSIVCSAVAAVVLTLFTRVSRRRAIKVAARGDSEDLFEEGAAAPAEQVTMVGGHERTGEAPTAQVPAPPPAAAGQKQQPTTTFAPGDHEQQTGQEEEEQEPAGAPAHQAAPVAQAVPAGASRGGAEQPGAEAGDEEPGAKAEDWYEEWDDEDVVFPIEDYDNLRVPDILPLLGELDADELEEVRAREVTGKARGTLVRRIDTLLASFGPLPERATAAATQAAETQPEAQAPSEPEPEPRGAFPSQPSPEPEPRGAFPSQPSPEPEPEPSTVLRPPPPAEPVGPRSLAVPPGAERREVLAGATASVAAPGPAGGGEPASVGGPAALPIADYDDLRLSEVLALLSELDPEELAAVEAHEKAGQRRRTVLVRINKLARQAPGS